MMRRMFAGLLLFVSATAFAGTSNALYYRGVMLGEDGKPVSGVFPMTFSLYKTKKSRRAVWKERMWVAVDEGGYIVRLGERKPLHLGKLNNLWIGIRIKGMGEVLREPFHPTVVSQAASGAKLPNVPSGVVKTTHNQGSVHYADTAGFAAEAGHAKTADEIGGLTLDQVLQKLGSAQQKGAGHIRIGSARRYGNHLGGSGGTTEYNEQCPEGYVMVGLRGAYGLYIDSAQIVCAPIETQ